eukprot:2586790-Rhodomonas_salina.2
MTMTDCESWLCVRAGRRGGGGGRSEAGRDRARVHAPPRTGHPRPAQAVALRGHAAPGALGRRVC